MLVPYFKNGVEQNHLAIPNRVWQGCQSKYQKTMDKNTDIVWAIVRIAHPTAWTIEASFRDTTIRSEDRAGE